MVVYSSRMTYLAIIVISAFALLFCLQWATGSLFTFRPVDPATGKVIFSSSQAANTAGNNQTFAVGTFDAAAYVDEQWVIQVMPTLEHNKVMLSELLVALNGDAENARQQYATPIGSTTFVVEGRAVVEKVNTSTPMGLITLRPLGTTSSSTFQLFAGPLVVTTAIRDVMPAMSLNSFTNQMQYADVAQALNDRALKQAYGDVAPASLEGQTIHFLGVLAYQTTGSLRIVPVQLDVEKQP